MLSKPILRNPSIILFLAFLGLFFSQTSVAVGAGPPEKGAVLPAFELPRPAIESDANALGLKSPTFQLKDIDCQILLVEIIGVYCPLCIQQAPIFNKLFARIQKKGMSDKVKVLAVAAGATANEIEYLRTNGTYEYPIAKDESYKVHKLLGEPRTPYTMLIGKDGKVLFAHMGVMEDTDPLFQQLESLVK